MVMVDDKLEDRHPLKDGFHLCLAHPERILGGFESGDVDVRAHGDIGQAAVGVPQRLSPRPDPCPFPVGAPQTEEALVHPHGTLAQVLCKPGGSTLAVVRVDEVPPRFLQIRPAVHDELARIEPEHGEVFGTAPQVVCAPVILPRAGVRHGDDGSETLLTLPQGFLHPLALGDVTGETGGTDNIPLVVEHGGLESLEPLGHALVEDGFLDDCRLSLSHDNRIVSPVFFS